MTNDNKSTRQKFIEAILNHHNNDDNCYIREVVKGELKDICTENIKCDKCKRKYLNETLDKIVQEQQNKGLQNENQYFYKKLRQLDKEIAKMKSYLDIEW